MFCTAVCFLQHPVQFMALKYKFQLLFTLWSDSRGDDRNCIKQMLKRIFNKEWIMLLFGMCSVRLQQLPYWDKPNTWNVMTTYWIKAPFISFTWNSSSIEFSSLILTVQCVPISLLSHHPLFSPPLFFPFLISSKFLIGRKAAVIKSRNVPRGTYYVGRTNSTMFCTFCLPVGLSAFDLGGRCQ